MNSKKFKLFCVIFATMQLGVVGILNALDANDQDQACDIGVQAYIYAYPMIVMDITRQVSTNVPAVTDTGAPMNQFYNMRTFPSATFCAVVRPNDDTLYSELWFDVSREPLVISVPDTEGRYYLLPMLDMWTDVFASPGARTTGTGAGNFAIIGPGWMGGLPDGIEPLYSPTNLGWIVGRIQTNGKEDYNNVHQIQDNLKATPLSQFGTPYVPPTNLPVNPNIDTKTPPPTQVANMNAQQYFELFAKLLKDNPPYKTDEAMVEKLGQIGIVPGQDFDFDSLDASTQDALNRAVNIAQKVLVTSAKTPPKTLENGWEKSGNDDGNFGTSYLQRATIALTSLGANLPEDAIYYFTFNDSNGQPYTGNNSYVIHFDKEILPPVNAFWSVTMYNQDEYFIENPINRYSIGSKNRLKYNKDGSLDIHIQYECNKKLNWLPAPNDTFNLTLRLYWPKNEVLKGWWKPPAVVQEE